MVGAYATIERGWSVEKLTLSVDGEVLSNWLNVRGVHRLCCRVQKAVDIHPVLEIIWKYRKSERVNTNILVLCRPAARTGALRELGHMTGLLDIITKAMTPTQPTNVMIGPPTTNIMVIPPEFSWLREWFYTDIKYIYVFTYLLRTIFVKRDIWLIIY